MPDFKTLIAEWYRKHIVPGWHKTWVVWASVLAVVGPELLQVAIDNSELAFQAMPFFDDSTKAVIRLVALMAIPIIRAVKQPSLQPEPERKEPV